MRFDLSLRCECGCVRGVAREVSPSAGFRFICYCNDCQAFARFLDRPDALDGAGGTDIYQMPPGRIALTAGTDALRCLRYSEKVLRWYTDCCRTPIGNTASGPRFPVVGLIHSFVSQALMSQAFMSQVFMSPEAPERAREEVLGSPRCRLYERSAIGPLPATAPPPPSLAMFVGHASKLLGWWACGLAAPNPFFDIRTNAPLSAPRALARNER
jgi:Family of unknown function (DUF6151)